MDAAGQVGQARAKALVVPAPELAVLVVTGTDRKIWLNGLVTCDLAKLKDGEAAYGLSVEKKGRILADHVFVNDPSQMFVTVPDAALAAIRANLDAHLIMEDAEVAPDARAFAVSFVHGPAAPAVLDAARGKGAVVAALDVTGLGGGIVLAPRETKAEIDAALARVAATGDAAGWDVLRLERAVPRFGVDFDATKYPQEASLEKRAVSFEKGCYLGQEVVCMLEMRGHVKQKLVQVVFEAGETPAAGSPVVSDAGDPLGQVTSAAKSPTANVPVALAMVKYAHARPGVAVRAGGLAGHIAEAPI